MRSKGPVRVQRQRGLSLLVVMIVLALGSLLALGSARTIWLNERLVSSLSDQQRAVAAAESLLRDAESDIRGERADGSPCSTQPGDTGCRGALADRRPFFPTEVHERDTLASLIGPGGDCQDGICLPVSTTGLNPQAMATRLVEEAASGASTSRAARYGQFTGASTSQALLSGQEARAWYWVEVFPAAADPGADVHPFVFRINAYVQGHQAGTRVLLQSLFIPNPPSVKP